MADPTAVFVGLVRDISSAQLGSVREFIYSTVRLFSDWRCYLYENDSDDHSRWLLNRWEHVDQHVTVGYHKHGHPRWPAKRDRERANAMASYRAACQNWVRQNYSNFDYVVVFDTDLQKWGDISESLAKPEWDVATSLGVEQRGKHCTEYDVWAMRAYGSWEPLAPGPRWLHEVSPEPFRRNSSFGGLAVYKMAAYLAGNYQHRPGDCEHVGFHQSMAEKGFDKLLVVPRQICLR